jgi:hypothetical protein
VALLPSFPFNGLSLFVEWTLVNRGNVPLKTPPSCEWRWACDRLGTSEAPPVVLLPSFPFNGLSLFVEWTIVNRGSVPLKTADTSS